jgi:hypothetical protein
LLAFLQKKRNMGTVSTKNETKLKNLLDSHRPGTVVLPAWMEQLGISRDLLKRYRRSGWLESLGPGAFRRPNEEVGWRGGLFSLQTQAGMPVHAGGMTALSLQGFAHYARLADEAVYLFSPPKTPLPAWFKNHDWGVRIRQVQTSILPASLGLMSYEDKNFAISISSPERAMLETLHLAPEEHSLIEAFQVMEGLSGLRPQLVQELLMACTSLKAKRLFLYLAEKASHGWLSRVDTDSVNLGSGARSLKPGGTYVAKYHLVVPKELASL